MNFGLGAFLRRLYLAASELHWSVLCTLLLGHMGLSYILLRVAGEPDLAPPVDYIYWYATTASTVGYGDLSPKGPTGRLIAAFFVMPGAIALFTTAIARAFSGLSMRWRRRRTGMGDYRDLDNATVLVGYDAHRTPRMIDELIADGGKDIVLIATDAIDATDARFRFIRATSLTNERDLERAGIAQAERIIVYADSEAETLAATLAVTARNESAHIVCYLRERDTAALIAAHCPDVEVVMTPMVELVVKALSDPGSSRLLTQLVSHTDDGATLYSTNALPGETLEDATRRLRAAGGILIATGGAHANEELHLAIDGAITADSRLFYISRERVAQ